MYFDELDCQVKTAKGLYARPIVIWFTISFFSRNDLFPEAVLNPT
jgi:hypothetical protein